MEKGTKGIPQRQVTPPFLHCSRCSGLICLRRLATRSSVYNFNLLHPTATDLLNLASSLASLISFILYD